MANKRPVALSWGALSVVLIIGGFPGRAAAGPELITQDERPLAWSHPLPLEPGTTAETVLEAWGPPREKFEFESKREEIWVYPQGQAVLKAGKLATWAGSENKVVEPQPTASAAPLSGSPGDYRVEEILGDLLRTQPADDGDSGGSRSPGGPLKSKIRKP